jgi:uncharacterized protein YbjT (DUF2867 family)
MKKILVTGATGNLGSAVVNALSSRGMMVRAASRQPDRIAPVANLEPVLLDFENTAGHEPALTGVNGLFLIAPPLDPEAPAKLAPIIDTAKRLGIGHIVFNSALGVDAVETAPLRAIERHLMASKVPYTILRPNFFMQNFSRGFIAPMIKQHDAIFLAAGEAKTSFIAVDDIAEVAAEAFAEKRIGREYNLTGPEALDHHQAAEIISKAAGRTISYRPVSEEAMLQGVRDSGMPDSAVRYMAFLYQAVRAGFMARITGEVESATGRAPVTFQAFAENNRQAWL